LRAPHAAAAPHAIAPAIPASQTVLRRNHPPRHLAPAPCRVPHFSPSTSELARRNFAESPGMSPAHSFQPYSRRAESRPAALYVPRSTLLLRSLPRRLCNLLRKVWSAALFSPVAHHPQLESSRCSSRLTCATRYRQGECKHRTMLRLARHADRSTVRF